jgi:hypothetical protein
VAEEGFLRQRGGDLDPITAIKGFFQYYAPEGQKYRVTSSFPTNLDELLI